MEPTAVEPLKILHTNGMLLALPTNTRLGLKWMEKADTLDYYDMATMEQRTFENVNSCLNTNIYSYLEASGGQSSNLYISMLFIFSTPVLIRHLWQLKTVVSLHLCLIRTVLLQT